MKLRRGTLQKLHEDTGYNLPYLSVVLSRKKKMSQDRAEQFEAFTGISKVTWLFGSEEEIKTAVSEKYDPCATCPNRAA